MAVWCSSIGAAPELADDPYSPSRAMAMRSSRSAGSPVGCRRPASHADTAGCVTPTMTARSTWVTPTLRRIWRTSISVMPL